jgi:hypothetical protein
VASQVTDPAGTGAVSADVIVDASVGDAWSVLTRWDSQSRWIVGTSVSRGDRTEPGLGDRFEARTALGPIGISDPMIVTAWDPPNRCEVRHLGRTVKGTGLFELFALPGERCRVVWTERIELPFGRFGTLAWIGTRPLVAAGIRMSLARLARLVETG